MGYYVSNMIGIRTGGVFSADADVNDMRARVAKIIAEMKETDNPPDIGDDPSHCMSGELTAHKGSYVVIAGVFNYWRFDQAQVFSRRLSEEFGVHVMHMSWDEEKCEVQCQIWLCGKPLYEINEHPIGDVLRRVC